MSESKSQATPTETITQLLLQDDFEQPSSFSGFTAEYLDSIDGLGRSVDRFIVRTNDGIVINDLLPGSGSIYSRPETNCVEAFVTSLYADIDYLLSSGEIGAITIAHELGHLNNPDDPKGFCSPHIESDRDTDPDAYYLEVFRKYLDQTNILWQTEVEAWDYGKAFATMFGIDEMRYEDMMSKMLEGHYYSDLISTIDDINNLIKRNLVKPNKEIQFYDLWAREMKTITMSELVEMTVNKEQEIREKAKEVFARNRRILHD